MEDFQVYSVFRPAGGDVIRQFRFLSVLHFCVTYTSTPCDATIAGRQLANWWLTTSVMRAAGQ